MYDRGSQSMPHYISSGNEAQGYLKNTTALEDAEKNKNLSANQIPTHQTTMQPKYVKKSHTNRSKDQEGIQANIQSLSKISAQKDSQTMFVPPPQIYPTFPNQQTFQPQYQQSSQHQRPIAYPQTTQMLTPQNQAFVPPNPISETFHPPPPPLYHHVTNNGTTEQPQRTKSGTVPSQDVQQEPFQTYDLDLIEFLNGFYRFAHNL